MREYLPTMQAGVSPTEHYKIICIFVYIFVSLLIFLFVIASYFPLNLFFFPSCISCSQPIRFALIFPFVYLSLFSIGLCKQISFLPATLEKQQIIHIVRV